MTNPSLSIYIVESKDATIVMGARRFETEICIGKTGM